METERLYQFAPDERPLLPGGPFSPAHPLARRLAYGAIAVVLGVADTFTNALTNVNVPYLAGPLGVYVAQASLLPAIFVAMNATGNLSLVKARIQFGIPRVTNFLLLLYAGLGLLQIPFPGFATAVLVRAACGLTAACLTTMTIYYLMQVFPPKARPLALVIGLGLLQLGTPLARLVPVAILASNGWYGLHLIEPAVVFLVLALINALPLPPSECSKAFEKLDFVTIGLMVVAMLLVCGVLGVGRVYWWSDAPWLGWMLAAAIPLFAAVVLIESHRTKPMLRLDWVVTGDILRFAAVAALVRVALAEQTYGSVGLLTLGGLNNDQLHTLFLWVILAMVFGIITACLTLSQERLRLQVMFAALAIAAGAFMDSGATNVTRPPELYLSQALIGFGTTMFIGPALVFGFLRMMAKGASYFVTFVVLFSITQNVGGLAGSALLGSYQVIQTRAHAASLQEHLLAGDPQVAQQIQGGAATVAGALTDPGLRGAEGAALLGQRLASEANVLAFNDVFRLVAFLALATAAYLLYRIFWIAFCVRRTQANQAERAAA
ncbi:MAG TPA: MFS transporter [Rhizomicrobium sp.]|nr:MFS transporter [Rhizomicrobium sp.]